MLNSPMLPPKLLKLIRKEGEGNREQLDEVAPEKFCY